MPLVCLIALSILSHSGRQELAPHGLVAAVLDFEGGEGRLIARLRQERGVAGVPSIPHGFGHRIELSDEAAQHGVLALLVEAGITTIRTSRPPLEEVCVQVLGDRGLRV